MMQHMKKPPAGPKGLKAGAAGEYQTGRKDSGFLEKTGPPKDGRPLTNAGTADRRKGSRVRK